MRLWGITDPGTVRPQNQDAYHFETDEKAGTFAIVCDGMGGAKAGNIASGLAVSTFTDALRRETRDGVSEDPEQVLLGAISEANRAVCYRASIDEQCSGMGTTLVVAWALESAVLLANVGDSRAYAISESGIEKVSRDHSLVEDLVRKGEITPEQARKHPQKNLITRALGAEENVEPDFYRIDRKEGTLLLLCSDGLSNMVTDQELLYEIAHGGPPEACCQRLLNIALTRGAPDNVTAVLMEL
ncbi:MAG: Stp1/IreP family PP2C-type Ser/Thr phosphatase [Oscillospiraceae bacterium]